MNGRIGGLIALAAALGMIVPQASIAEVPAPALPPVRLDVTGDPAPVETLQLAILTAARAIVPEARTGQLSLTETAPPLQPLPPASETALRAVVQVGPAGARSVVRTMPFEIKNDVLPWSDAQSLLVSNSPETLTFGKVLLQGSVASGRTVRLLYHHANGSPTQRMTIGVELSNPAREPVVLWVTGAAGSAGADELAVGHGAARAFLDQYWHHAGFMLRVAANTTLPLFVHDLGPGAVASGLMQFTLVDGDRVNVQVYARMQGEMDPPPMSFAPDFDQVHSRGVFDRPQFIRPLVYAVGGPFAMMQLGDDQDALRESQTKRVLSGNYGVVYSFPIEVSNPSPLPARLGLVMHAVGGQTSGTLLVDDRIVDVPRVPSGESRLVATIRVAGGAQRRIVISAMPEPGANYPVRLSLGTDYQ